MLIAKAGEKINCFCTSIPKVSRPTPISLTLCSFSWGKIEDISFAASRQKAHPKRLNSMHQQGRNLRLVDNLTNLWKTMTQVWLAQSWANVTLDPSVAETKPTFEQSIKRRIFGNFKFSYYNPLKTPLQYWLGP